MELTFKDWMECRLDSPLHEAFIEFGLLSEAEQSALLRGPESWQFDLKYPGKHLDKILTPGDQGGARKIIGPQGNSLIPVHSIQWMMGDNKKDDSPVNLSHFVRDQPMIGAFSQTSPENMAATIIFVLLTIRADFQQVMQDFPTLMLILMSKFQNVPLDPGGEKLREVVYGMEQILGSLSPAGERSKTTTKNRTIRQGYGLGTSLFDKKFNSVSKVWNNREMLFNQLMELVDKQDTVKLFEKVLRTIDGLGPPKAGFVVQLMFGELGCIDMHNVNLYSQYYTDRKGIQKSDDFMYSPDHLKGFIGADKNRPDEIDLVQQAGPATQRGRDMYAALSPRMLNKSFTNYTTVKDKRTGQKRRKYKSQDVIDKGWLRTVKRYIDVIKGLEQDGITTVKLWDYWVTYVAHIYGQEGARGQTYSRTGAMSGSTMDPENDKADARLLRTRDNIPDRNTIVTGGNKTVWVKDEKSGDYKAHKRGSDGELYPIGTYDISGMEKEAGAGGASLAHHAVWWWRNKSYWLNLLAQAEKASKGQALDEPPEGMRYQERPANLTASYLVAKPLAYLSVDEQLQRNVFPDKTERMEYMEQLGDALSRLGFFSKDSWLKDARKNIKAAEKELEASAKEKTKKS